VTTPAPGPAPRRGGDRNARAARGRHPSTGGPQGLLGEPDPMGKMALFSGDAADRPFGTLFMECSSCGRETPVSAIEAAKAALPLSVHIPFRRYHSFLRCPSCGRRTWVRMRWTLQ
jgi:uncharacterized protein with PIN domain